jgi:hypothetical protein
LKIVVILLANVVVCSARWINWHTLFVETLLLIFRIFWFCLTVFIWKSLYLSILLHSPYY